jgi:hypothetical protein
MRKEKRAHRRLAAALLEPLVADIMRKQRVSREEAEQIALPWADDPEIDESQEHEPFETEDFEALLPGVKVTRLL